LKQSASDFLGKAVNAAVITVPTNFSAAQRGALISSAKRAGIDVLQLVHEPVAELMAYDARPETVVVDKLVVVADLGGTRSDASVIASRGGMYTILATAHDYELGGANLDQIIIDHFAKEFMKKHQIDPRENERGLAKLKLEGEATKKALSLGTNATLNIESLTNGIDFSSTINRTRYELLAGKVFSQFTNLIEQAVKKAGLDVLDINEVCGLSQAVHCYTRRTHESQVILSGGSSHTPRLASRLQSIFPVTTKILAPSTSPTALNPSDLAARGAAIQASLIQEFDKEDIEQSIHPMVTVTPHLRNAIGVRLLSPSVLGESSPDFQPLIDVETALPARRVAQYRVSNTGGDVLVRVCEGVREIKTIKPMPKSKEDTNGGETDADSELESDEEEEEIRQIVWNESRPIAEIALKDVKSGSKVEVVVNINSDLGLQVTARAIGSRGGVRFAVDAPNVTSDGSI
jgi:molecular chaperone DnaK (HSP70)